MIKDRSGGTRGTELLRRVQLGHSLMYLLRGAPSVYYGDEVGIIGAGGDKQARQDLFPTKVREWQTEERVGSPPIGTGSALELASHPVGDHLKALAALREAHPALSVGSTAVRVARGGLLVVSRFDAAAQREYLAAFNASTTPQRAAFASATGSSWTPLLGASAAVQSSSGGRVTLNVPPLTAVLYRADGPPRPSSGRPVDRGGLRRPLGAAPRRRVRHVRSAKRRVRAQAGRPAVAATRRRRLAALPGLPRSAALPAR